MDERIYRLVDATTALMYIFSALAFVGLFAERYQFMGTGSDIVTEGTAYFLLGSLALFGSIFLLAVGTTAVLRYWRTHLEMNSPDSMLLGFSFISIGLAVTAWSIFPRLGFVLAAIGLFIIPFVLAVVLVIRAFVAIFTGDGYLFKWQRG